MNLEIFTEKELFENWVSLLLSKDHNNVELAINLTGMFFKSCEEYFDNYGNSKISHKTHLKRQGNYYKKKCSNTKLRSKQLFFHKNDKFLIIHLREKNQKYIWLPLFFHHISTNIPELKDGKLFNKKGFLK